MFHSKLFLILCILLNIYVRETRPLSIIPNEELQECPDKPGKGLSANFNLKNAEFVQFNDSHFTLSGYFTSTKDFNSHLPIQVMLISEKKSGDSWTGVYKRYIPSLCDVLLNPVEFWYSVTSKFNEKVCPPKIGTTYNFVSIAIQMKIDNKMLSPGDYRSIITIRQSTGFQEETDICIINQFELIDDE